MKPAPAHTILILEDDPGVARLQRLRLQRVGFVVDAVSTPAEAMDRIQAERSTCSSWTTGLQAPRTGWHSTHG